MENAKSFGGVQIEQIVDDMFKSAYDKLGDKEDVEMQEVIALHGRPKVFAWLIGGMIKSVNPEGVAVEFRCGNTVVHTVVDGSLNRKPLSLN
jgi:hypothetical protein